MNIKLIGKLISNEYRNNKNTIIPYLISGVLTVMTFFILFSLAFCPYIYKDHFEAFYGAQTIAIMLEIGGEITGIFAAAFLIYANQFVMKGKRKEIGLYGVLGLDRKHITSILIIETFINAGIIIGCGIILGTFFNKIMLLILYKIIGQAPVSGLFFSGRAFAMTLEYYGVISLICLLANVFSVNVANPIELLKSDKTGEKEPPVKIGLLIIGLITTGAGYYIAISCKSATDAINMFFGAVILVMIGTYSLFTAGSIFILKRLKNNKKFYFKTSNFISVSNLMYRMKHNASGLASICILSTGVILLLSCAGSLYALGQRTVNSMYAYGFRAQRYETVAGKEEEYEEALQMAAEKTGIELSDNHVYYEYYTTTWKDVDGNYTDEIDVFNPSYVRDVYYFDLARYNEYSGDNASLQVNEILLYSSRGGKVEATNILGEDYKVVGNPDIEKIKAVVNPTMALFDTLIIVFDSENTTAKVCTNDKLLGNPGSFPIYIGYDVNGTYSDDTMNEFIGVFKEAAGITDEDSNIGFKQMEERFFLNVYGGVFFVGLFLAALFLMATVLIIYYKQLAEGLEDRERFQIMQNVGMTDEEIRATIKKQILILFFLPVVTAIIHMAVASNIIRLFLRVIVIVDSATFAMTIAVVSLVFVIVYAMVYKLTSREYYKIVGTK